MTRTTAVAICRQLLIENAESTSTMHGVLSPERAEAIRTLADAAASTLLLPNSHQKPIHSADGGRLTTLRKRGPR